MRLLLIVFLLSCAVSSPAQTLPKSVRTPVGADSIPAEGRLLAKNWRWHAGDNAAWADPALNDASWESIRPTFRLGKLPQVRTAHLGWFRLTLTADSTLQRTPLAIDVFLNGAADIYLDGALIRRLGVVSATHTQPYKRVRGEMYALPPLAPGPHTLAVRFSTHPLPWYVPQYLEGEETLEIKLVRTEAYAPNSVRRTAIQLVVEFLLVGSFLMLSGIHFLYFAYRRRRLNLIFGLTTLFYCFDNIANNLPPFIHSIPVASWADYIGSVFSYSFPVMLLATYYTYLQRPFSRLFWIVAVITVSIIVAKYSPIYHANNLINEVPTIAFVVSILLLFIDGLRITVLALQTAQTRDRAVVILISFTVIIMILIVSGVVIAAVSWRYPELRYSVSNIIGGLVTFCLPATLAFLLAKEHDQTNTSLQKRLIEVEKLSTEKESLLTQQNETLERKVAQRTQKLNQSLQELRETQTQLVQREKMASLGELTAGIAHEIQNPLNFVNNFSEVSAELLDELKAEQARPAPDRDPQLEAELLADVHQNVSKISFHGQRAASIVRGMLQHSRASTGERTPTDLNALGDEYLRLSYHGLRAKDKSRNASLHTSLDPSLETVDVVAQDVGRVLLNLFNNAFYAVWDKAKTAPPGFKPTVWLFTRQLEGHIEIKVQDNGNGIPEDLQRKIFQPFFTTKPTGQGTGLGLSLSYDIITKGHAGTLSVETVPGEYTAFIITLPVS